MSRILVALAADNATELVDAHMAPWAGDGWTLSQVLQERAVSAATNDTSDAYTFFWAKP